MHQGLSLLTDGTGIQSVHQLCQIHACGDGAMHKSLAEVPCDSQDQGGIQTCRLGTLILVEHVPLSGVQAGHKDGKGEGCGPQECRTGGDGQFGSGVAWYPLACSDVEVGSAVGQELPLCRTW